MSAIIPNEWYKYDELGRYYYLTPVGAEALTGIDSLSTDWNDAERRLKKQGQLLKTVMTISTSDDKRPRRSRKDYIEYIQFKNPNSEQNFIFQMLSEIAEWSWDVDGDRMLYEEGDNMKVLNALPITVKQLGHDSNLIFYGKTIFEVPEEEYQVGY